MAHPFRLAAPGADESHQAHYYCKLEWSLVVLKDAVLIESADLLPSLQQSPGTF